MLPDIVVVDDPTEADREAILRPLKAFNASASGDYPSKAVALLLKDETGSVVGGL